MIDDQKFKDAKAAQAAAQAQADKIASSLRVDVKNTAIAFLREASCLDPAMYEELVMLLVTDQKFRSVLQSLIVAKSEYDARNERLDWDLRLGETNSVQLWYSDPI